MDVVVRQAFVDDAAAIASIHVRGWQAAYAGIVDSAYLDALSVGERQATWMAGLESGRMPDGGSVFVASCGSEVRGWMTCGASRDDDVPIDVGELHGIYVDPDAQGSGVGSALMDYCLNELRGGGFVRATLWVLNDNVAARRWYERRGWQPDGAELTFTLGTQTLAEVRYAIELY